MVLYSHLALVDQSKTLLPPSPCTKVKAYVVWVSPEATPDLCAQNKKASRLTGFFIIAATYDAGLNTMVIGALVTVPATAVKV